MAKERPQTWPGTLDAGPLAKEHSARKRDQHGGNITSKLLQNGSKMAPKWLPNGSQIGPGGLLEGSWRSLGALKKAWSAKGGLPGAYGALLEASWVALGAEKRSLERLLAAPRGIPREVSAILGAKGVPKGGPKWVQNKVQKRFKLKMTKSQNLKDVSRNSLTFQVPGSPFRVPSGVQNGGQNGVSTLKAPESLLDGSWSALRGFQSR